MSGLGAATDDTTTDDAAARRAALLERLGAWLDEALADEAPPAGVAAELLGAPPDQARACDLLSLWSALTTLGQEVKLQGRTFHALEQAVAPLPGAVEALRQANQRLLDEARRDAEARALDGVLELLLDLRERLRHGREAARAHAARQGGAPAPRGWLARGVERLLVGAPPPGGRGDAERAFVQGYELALARLDDALRERGLAEVECVGRPFDPHRMRAVELVDAPGQADGTVVGVQRSGWMRGDELVRAAEVTVVRGGDR
ncbi:MAG: nucleotide exchange factor GrpE [Planctomycetes bacterium]|nr:nucleotide exchange factor GrpE [Planctomycetota bacterium]